jgi:hypothetical protein
LKATLLRKISRNVGARLARCQAAPNFSEQDAGYLVAGALAAFSCAERKCNEREQIAKLLSRCLAGATDRHERMFRMGVEAVLLCLPDGEAVDAAVLQVRRLSGQR